MKAKIAQIRDYYGLSENQLAKRIGVSQSTVNDLMTGKTEVSPKVLMKVITEFSDISCEWLLRGKGSMLLTDEGSAKVASLSQDEKRKGREKFQEVSAPRDILRARFHQAQQDDLDLLIEQKIEEVLKKKGIM